MKWENTGIKNSLAIVLGIAGGVLLGYHWRAELLFHVGLMLLCLAGYGFYQWTKTPAWRAWALGFSFVCGFAYAGSMVVNAYALNYRGFFYLGLFLQLDLLILYVLACRPQGPLRLAIHTAVLGILLLPVADFCTLPPRHLSALRPAQRPYAYDIARRDPVTFQLWWDCYLEEWDRVAQATLMPDPAKKLPFRLRPNSTAKWFDGELRINSLGFRDGEFPREKNGVYRIVALGESTTMGCTSHAGDRPWPKVLEQIIQDRLHPSRPVQVVNAGVWAYTLADNVTRLHTDILPLQPDMIISYHGYNSFVTLDAALAPVRLPNPPRYIERPVFLLARAEYRLRSALFWHRFRHQKTPLISEKSVTADPLDSVCARLYEKLNAITHTNHIRLVLANFNLAVNAQSHPDVIEFYRSAFPEVHEVIRVNDRHSRLLEQLAQRHPAILTLNVQSNLHGQHAKFIDLVHFTQTGRNQLASNIFEGIQAVLKADLATR